LASSQFVVRLSHFMRPNLLNEIGLGEAPMNLKTRVPQS
jgi:hypothetical protein